MLVSAWFIEFSYKIVIYGICLLKYPIGDHHVMFSNLAVQNFSKMIFFPKQTSYHFIIAFIIEKNRSIIFHCLVLSETLEYNYNNLFHIFCLQVFQILLWFWLWLQIALFYDNFPHFRFYKTINRTLAKCVEVVSIFTTIKFFIIFLF